MFKNLSYRLLLRSGLADIGDQLFDGLVSIEYSIQTKHILLTLNYGTISHLTPFLLVA